MLHILWLIIKFILILLGILLGLVLLAILAVLFVPVRYRAEGEKSETKLSGKANVSWLFHAVSFWVRYEEGKLSQDLKIFGISLNRIREWRNRRRSSKEEKERLKPPKEPAKEQTMQNKAEEAPAIPVLEEKTEAPAAEEEEIAGETPPIETADATERRADEKPESFFGRVGGWIRTAAAKLKAFLRKLGSVFRKILGIPGRILKKLKKISLTIQGIYDKISYWKEFAADERIKAAIHLAWSQCKRLLKHIAPTKISGHVKFGMEDPFVTGEILAGLGMTYPIHKNRIQVMPVFDEKVLAGEAQCRGRIYGIVLVIAACKLYFDKNIKYMIKRWNHKEG